MTEYGFKERAAIAWRVFRNGGVWCLHLTEPCVYCERDRWIDTAAKFKVQRQKDLRRGHCVRGEMK